MFDHQFMLVYAKIILDKKSSIKFVNVYLGGIYETQEEADLHAADCVKAIKGGTILPRVFLFPRGGNLIDEFYRACDRFDTIEKQMIESQSIIK